MDIPPIFTCISTFYDSRYLFYTCSIVFIENISKMTGVHVELRLLEQKKTSLHLQEVIENHI